MEIKSIKVVVYMITYNQVDFITDAIQSVIDQITDFPFLLIIGDDASSDNTTQVCINFKNRYPDKISLHINKNNLGPVINAQNIFQICFSSNADYIAMLEGDDYWTDPFKLQKQVDFLEANLDFSLSFHPVNVLFPDGKMEEDYLVKGIIGKSESTIYDMAVLGNYIHTPSVVFRNVLNEYPELMKKSPIGDFFLWMLLAQHGKIKKLPEVMAVYRLGVGVHSTQSEKFRQSAFLKALSLLSETMEEKTIVEIIKNRIAAIKSTSLPYSVRGLDNFGDLVVAENLKDYVSIRQLLKTIFLKIKRRF